jgi:hypothetical protein
MLRKVAIRQTQLTALRPTITTPPLETRALQHLRPAMIVCCEHVMIESQSLNLKLVFNSGVKFHIVDRQGLLGDLIHIVASFNFPPFCSALMGKS